MACVMTIPTTIMILFLHAVCGFIHVRCLEQSYRPCTNPIYLRSYICHADVCCDQGKILYNGIDINEFDSDLYKARIGAVFQDYKIFTATIAENVLADECTEDNKAVVYRALELATFGHKLSTLEKGINTILTREFDEDGVNLSGGEAQKIAISRVFAKPYDLIIMDEPSSALDPIAEYNMNCHIDRYLKIKP